VINYSLTISPSESAVPGKPKMMVREYLEQLKETKKGKPAQIKDALDIYMELWDKVIENGTVSQEDEVAVALSKIDKAGGLYEAAG
jgi:hypothetical protein